MDVTDLTDPMDELDVLDVIAGLTLASGPAITDLFPDDVHQPPFTP